MLRPFIVNVSVLGYFPLPHILYIKEEHFISCIIYIFVNIINKHALIMVLPNMYYHGIYIWLYIYIYI